MAVSIHGWESLYYYRKKNYTITGIIEDYTDYVYADGYGVANYGNVQFFIDEAKEGYYCYVKCYPGKVEEVQEWIQENEPYSPSDSLSDEDEEYYREFTQGEGYPWM